MTTENEFKAEPFIPSISLESSVLIDAATAQCGLDREAVATLEQGLRALVVSDDWAAEAESLQQIGLTAQHVTGTLAEALTLPGDLIVARHSDQTLSLLRYLENRWLYIGENGQPLDIGPDLENQDSVEAVLLCLPVTDKVRSGFASLKALWPQLRSAWAEVGIASLFINSGQLLLPIFALLIYDKIALNGLFETLWALVFGMGLYLVTDAGMRLVRSWTTERISVDQALRSDEKLWAEMVAQVDLPPGGFPRFLSNYRDLASSRDFVSSNYLLSIADIPFLLLYLGVIGFISWPLMIATLVLVIIFSGTGYVMYARQKRLSNESEQQNTRKMAFMGEALSCLDVVRTTPGAGSFLRSWREVAQQTSGIDTKKRLAMQQMGMLSSALQTVTTVVILTSGVYLIHVQLLSIGKLIACNLLANRAMALVASLYAVIGKWQDFKRAAARMESSLEKVSERTATPRPQVDGQIAVLGLGKCFEGRPPALESVTFNIKPGERIALLGRPGAGKSTLLRCMAGLCRPDDGQILIDGLALDDISRFDRVKWLAYKGQDPAIFAGTLEENLRVAGCRNPEQLQESIWASGLDTEFNSGRMSLGMQLEERGSNLSGGQRQKVALARVFAQPSRILLLDEPTLGLDPESERLLAARLPKLLDKGCVMIMTTHSPIMLETVQRIIALDGGRVVADGPREKLVTLPTKAAANAG